jgi:hypothetical protein
MSSKSYTEEFKIEAVKQVTDGVRKATFHEGRECLEFWRRAMPKEAVLKSSLRVLGWKSNLEGLTLIPPTPEEDQKYEKIEKRWLRNWKRLSEDAPTTVESFYGQALNAEGFSPLQRNAVKPPSHGPKTRRRPFRSTWVRTSTSIDWIHKLVKGTHSKSKGHGSHSRKPLQSLMQK